MISVAEQLATLEAAVASRVLDQLCRDHRVELLVQFGSSVRAEDPGDIDLAVAFEHDSEADLLVFMDALADLLPGDHLDVMDLDHAGPVARHRALTDCRVIFARIPAAFFERQIFAINHYIETQPLRDALLRILAS